MIELVILVGFVCSGFTLAYALGVRGWLTGILAFPLGVATFIAVGFVLVTVFAPTWPLVALVVSIALSVGMLLVRSKLLRDPAHRPDRRAMLPLALGVIAAIVIFVVTRLLNLVTWHTDSFFNIESSMLLAENLYSEVSPKGASKRLLAIPLVHALSIQVDEGVYFESFAPMVSLSVLGLVWLLIHRAVAASDPPTTFLRSPAFYAAAIAVLLLVTNNRYVFHTFYVNGHLLFAALLLIVVGLLWARDAKLDLGFSHERSGVLVACCVIPALVVTRPESALVLTLVLVVAWTTPASAFEKTLVTVVTGAAVFLWHARLAIIPLERESSVPASTFGPLVLGILLMVAPVVLRRLPVTMSNRLPGVTEIGLWIALAGFALLDPMILAQSVYRTVVNLAAGQGGWGLSLVVLGLIGAALLILTKGSGDRVLRFVVTTTIPLVLLLAYLRGAPYRVGDGDSLNRMWIQFVPLLVVFVVQRAFLGVGRRLGQRFKEAIPDSKSDSAVADT